MGRAGMASPWRSGIGEDGDVAVEIDFGGRPGKRAADFARPRDRHARKREQLGGLLGLDLGSAEIPAAFDVEADLEAEPGRLFEGVAIQLAPARAAERRAGGHHAVVLLPAAVGVHQDRAAVAFGAHLFQVASDGGFVGVAVEPPPVAAEARFGRRGGEA